MRIIPVIDLAAKTVVHAVAGRRNQYRPIESKLCESTSPIDIAQAFRSRFGLTELYLADLDAIQGKSQTPDWSTIGRLTENGFKVWLDAGPGVLDASSHTVNALERVILATEWLTNRRQVLAAIDQYGSDKLVFGIDLRSGQVVTSVPAWSELDSDQLVGEAVDLGVRSVVLLDLATVGTEQGPSQPLLEACQRVTRRHPAIDLITGGGVRSLQDLKQLDNAGCHGALVATALHKWQRLPRPV